MKKDLTEIVFILDESGSMSSVKTDTIGGFNEFIESQKKIKGEVQFTFIKFSDYYNVVNDGTPLENVSPLNDETYAPSFSTALLDAVGKAIDSLGNRLSNTPEDQRPEKVLVAVLTDGQENASSEYDTKKVLNMVKHQRDKYNWEFIFLGADIDAWAGGSSMGINTNINISKSDMKKSLKGLSNYAASYRSDYSRGMIAETFSLSEDELDAQMKDIQSQQK
jgi:uncharacterized protein YegL